MLDLYKWLSFHRFTTLLNGRKEVALMILRNVLALRESINEYRENMDEVAKKKGIADPYVVQISKQLDGKIIMLQKIMSDTPSLSKAKPHYHDEPSLNL